jgi:hypothetical protein
MMRGSAGFDSNEARRKLLEERQDVTTLQLTPNYHLAFNVNTVDLKNPRPCPQFLSRPPAPHGKPQHERSDY